MGKASKTSNAVNNSSKPVKAGVLKDGQVFTFVKGAKHRWVVRGYKNGQMFVASMQECNFKSVPATRTVYTA
jgi:hypothetical protein